MWFLAISKEEENLRSTSPPPPDGVSVCVAAVAPPFSPLHRNGSTHVLQDRLENK